MVRFAVIALIPLFATTAGVSAQTSPASTKGTVSITGCVAPVQRDGSLAPKAGTFATPNTAPMEANNPEPTGAYMLLDATRDQNTATNAPTSYALAGHEPELAKLHGSRVHIVGSPIPAVSPGRTVDAIQRIRVASVKKIAGSCTATKK